VIQGREEKPKSPEEEVPVFTGVEAGTVSLEVSSQVVLRKNQKGELRGGKLTWMISRQSWTLSLKIANSSFVEI
jgi:hypothetical protein